MNKIVLRLFGMDVFELSWGEDDDEDKPEEMVDPASVGGGSFDRAGEPAERVWSGGDDVRPADPAVRTGLAGSAPHRLGFH